MLWSARGADDEVVETVAVGVAIPDTGNAVACVSHSRVTPAPPTLVPLVLWQGNQA